MKKPIKRNSLVDIREQFSGCKTPEMAQLEDSNKTKNTIPKILCGIFFFFFSCSSECLNTTMVHLQ